jgi:uncharacterized membrane protein
MNAEATALIQSPAGVLAALAGTAAFYFWLERSTGWKLFQYLVPLLWIYATPLVLRNLDVLPAQSPVYGAMREIALPMFIVLLLLSVDVAAALRVMGRGVGVMLLGTAGVVVGAPIGFWVVHRWLGPEAWKGFGALAGSWIGGTGNMAAVAGALDTPEDQFGLAVLADTVIYVVWLPLLLVSKGFAERFNRWTRVDPKRLARMEEAALAQATEKQAPEVRHVLYLLALGAGVTWLSGALAPLLPEVGQVLTTSTWSILLVTTFGIALSLTPARRIAGSHELAMALVYLFVARMGATASLEGFAQAPAFLLGALIWIAIHGLFCLAGAKLLRVDIHSVAIASAANIGAAASAPVVAAYHRESLVPASILMALIGYAIGTYAALIAAHLCRLVAGA